MIYHVYSAYEPTRAETIRRMKLAHLTWQAQPWTELPVPEKSGRIFRDCAGMVPFVKDILQIACNRRDDADIIVFTNADICVSRDCSMKIAAALQGSNAIYCFRRDFGHLNTPLPDPLIGRGVHYPGTDLKAFRVGWWRKYRDSFPDMLLGREAWDAVMRHLMEMTNPGHNSSVPNLIYHERHSSTWEDPRNRNRLPSQLHNLQLAREWMHEHGFQPRTIGI